LTCISTCSTSINVNYDYGLLGCRAGTLTRKLRCDDSSSAVRGAACSIELLVQPIYSFVVWNQIIDQVLRTERRYCKQNRVSNDFCGSDKHSNGRGPHGYDRRTPSGMVELLLSYNSVSSSSLSGAALCRGPLRGAGRPREGGQHGSRWNEAIEQLCRAVRRTCRQQVSRMS